ncbi:hypothetical protein CAPTEDRAFT_210002 [Capitella teleta]|uniref:Cadherin domain-containing protein n=1 Tax=Capitella teleta TaxID=283909 RepID=R7VER2_CAPTE|nr:hypothetical protein CAPTEDRAFT_210002 [Capitella teleta]|eukprot:ELU14776.1 hypothetical protein CAPTEDRAFT_210002 [Capitella teleta]
MPGSLFRTLFLIACAWQLASTLMLHRRHLPATVKPGYRVASLTHWGQRYSIDDPEMRNYFSVLSNGDVITSSDISSLEDQRLTIPVLNSLASKSWMEMLHVEVSSSEHILHFPRDLYEGFVSENLPPGAIIEGISDLHAVGGGSHEIHYAITAGATDLFTVVELSGNQVQIDSRDVLDREHQSEYMLTLRAKAKHDQPTFTKIRIIVNDTEDNAPVFEKQEYDLVIPDTTPLSATVLRPKVHDPDLGELTFTLDDPLDVFTINAKTGSVLLSSVLPLTAQSYKMTVNVEDPAKHRVSALVRVVIEGATDDIMHVRTRREVRATKHVEVPENYNMGNLLDLDNDFYERFHFRPPAPEKLDLNTVTGVVRLKPGEKLDYEETTEVDFIIVITRTDNPSYILISE